MIAVEFTDWNGPRTSANGHNKLCVRTGLLLQVSPTTRDPVNVAYVLVKAMAHDDKYRAKEGDTIIVPVKLEQITVKGVPIPFEP